MGDKVILTLEERTITGKKVKQLRKQGLLPAIVYGHDLKAKPVMANAVVMEKVYQQAGKHQPIELTVGSSKKLAMIKSADFDPVKRRLRHLSFHVVKQNEDVETSVRVHVENEGETEAEKAGLVVLQAIETIDVKARPMNLPESMVVPSDQLKATGDHVTVADIRPIEGVTILTEPEIVVATVYEPSALAAQNDAAGGDATEESTVDTDHGGVSDSEEAGSEKVEKS